MNRDPSLANRHRMLASSLPCKIAGQAYDCDIIRMQRHAKAQELRERLGKIVPAYYLKARLLHFKPAFVKLLMGFQKRSGLILWGNPGVGKTYAMAALARHFGMRGRLCRRVNYEELCVKIRSTFTGNSVSELSILKPFIDADMLFLEDVGVATSIGKQESDFSLRLFYNLLNSRIERCKPTFITTNRSIEAMQSTFDERISSRLHTFMVIKMEGRDKRRDQQNDR